jgi:hypothetical protein
MLAMKQPAEDMEFVPIREIAGIYNVRLPKNSNTNIQVISKVFSQKYQDEKLVSIEWFKDKDPMTSYFIYTEKFSKEP